MSHYPAAPDPLPKSQAEAPARELTLRRPLQMTVEQADGEFVVWNEEFRVYGVGDTLDQAVRDFRENLIAVYESYVEEPADDLSTGARRLRDKLAEAFEVR